MRLQPYFRQVGRNIKAARVRRGLRQLDVREKLGLNLRHYQKVESGQVNVTLRTLAQLAELFKTTVEELVRKD